MTHPFSRLVFRALLLVGCLGVVSLAFGQDTGAPSGANADRQLQKGVQAAGAGDLARAKAVFSEGARAYPGDARFAVELAGVAFLDKDYAAAKRWLHRARRLGSADPYVNEFLGTLYLLEGNVEAALVLWNPLRKPLLADGPMGSGLEPMVVPALASDAAAYSGGSVLTQREFLRTLNTVDMLDVCGTATLALAAREEERHEANVRCTPKASFGENRVATALLLARGLVYQAVQIEVPNVDRRAASLSAFVRWDARKRRARFEASAPLAGRASWRVGFFADARHEYWQMLSPESRAPEQAFLLRRWEGGAVVQALVGSRARWQNRVTLSHRSYPIASVAALGEERLDGGSSIRYAHKIDADVLRFPLRRVFVSASGEASMERYFRVGDNVYRGGGALDISWFPAASGNDGRTTLRIAAATLSGNVPLTDLYTVGLERDGSIPLRAHLGTSDGRKGSALYGHQYAVANLDVEKVLLRSAFATISAVPFLDAGWVRDPYNRYGARKVQFDAGLQLVARTVAGTEFRLSYGWDLRRGKGGFYAWSGPLP